MSQEHPDVAAHRRESPVILPLLLAIFLLGLGSHLVARRGEEALAQAEETIESRLRAVMDFPHQFSLGGRSITRARLEIYRDSGTLPGPRWLHAAEARRREAALRTRAAVALVVMAAIQGDIAGMPKELAALKARRKDPDGELDAEQETMVTWARVILSGLRHVRGRGERERLLRVFRTGLARRVLPKDFMPSEQLYAVTRSRLGMAPEEEAAEPVMVAAEPAPEPAWVAVGPALEPEPAAEVDLVPEPEVVAAVVPEPEPPAGVDVDPEPEPDPAPAPELEVRPLFERYAPVPLLEPVSLQLVAPTTAP